MATWPSGKAGACKALTTGSNPVVASKLFNPFVFKNISICARTPSLSGLHGMCGSATVPAQGTWDVWQCHGSRAESTGCVAVPRFPRRNHRMCGSATVPARGLTSRRAWETKRGHTLSDAAPEIPVWWPHQDSNLEPVDYESIALTVAPWGHVQASIINEINEASPHIFQRTPGLSLRDNP